MFKLTTTLYSTLSKSNSYGAVSGHFVHAMMSMWPGLIDNPLNVKKWGTIGRRRYGLRKKWWYLAWGDGAGTAGASARAEARAGHHSWGWVASVEAPVPS